MRQKRFLWLLPAFCLLTLLFVGHAAAQETVTDDDVNEVARDLFCPVCENTPLDVCPTQACTDWRNEIRRQLEGGASEDEIEAYFVARYGDRVLATPRTTGVALWVWLTPVAFVVIGGLFFGRFLLSNRRTEAAEPVDVPPSPDDELPDDPYLRQIELELKEKT
jgi:cytochrome c-type biogenesis protein CcmH